MIGFESSDDAAVYRIDDQTAMIQTVDLFPPLVDDPYQYGQIAAANALSDVYAMGGTPKLALNILCIPEDLPKDLVQGILAGGYDKVKEAGAIVAGGHTMKDQEPKYGLSVTGFARPQDILANNRARPGDVLILTKALGTGILTTAWKAGLVAQPTYDAMLASMVALNRRAKEIMSLYPVHSCTDVTGFGLLGHAYEMAYGSGSTIRLDAHSVPELPEAREMAKLGIIPAGAYANRDALVDRVEVGPFIPLDLLDLLYDPQTSGGLLIAIPERDGQRLLRDLQGELAEVAIVGQVLPSGDAPLIVR